MNRKSRKKETLTPYERRKRRLEKRFSTAPKTTGQKVAGAVIDNICWIVGCSLYSIGVVAFALPNSIAQSGTTGLAIIVNHLFEFIPLGTANFLLNVPLMILAFIFIGWRFVAKTMWVTVILSATLDLFSKFLPTYTGDKILSAIFCGVCTGAGLAIVFMRGATTGGTDVVGRLVHKAFPHIQIGKVIMAADAIIVILGAVVFRSIESAMYAVIVIFVNSRLLDYILYGTGSGKLLLAVTEHAQEISDAITSKMGRGVSILPVKGGYTGKEKNMVVCAVKKKRGAPADEDNQADRYRYVYNHHRGGRNPRRGLHCARSQLNKQSAEAFCEPPRFFKIFSKTGEKIRRLLRQYK